jgi:hypothetical protein
LAVHSSFDFAQDDMGGPPPVQRASLAAATEAAALVLRAALAAQLPLLDWLPQPRPITCVSHLGATNDCAFRCSETVEFHWGTLTSLG